MEHSSRRRRRPRRVVGRNSKSSLFRKNQIASRDSILTPFSMKPPRCLFFLNAGEKRNFKIRLPVPLEKRLIKRES